MLAACTIARAMVCTLSIFACVCGSSSPVYASLRPKAWLDWRIEMMSTSGAMPLYASAACPGGGGGGCGPMIFGRCITTLGSGPPGSFAVSAPIANRLRPSPAAGTPWSFASRSSCKVGSTLAVSMRSSGLLACTIGWNSPDRLRLPRDGAGAAESVAETEDAAGDATAGGAASGAAAGGGAVRVTAEVDGPVSITLS